MTIYIIQIAFILMLSLLSSQKDKAYNDKECSEISMQKNKDAKMFLLIEMVALWFIMAFRSKYIGSDTYNYSFMFSRISESQSFLDAMRVSNISAPIYVGYAYVLGKIFSAEQWIIICNSLVICSFLFLVIRKRSRNYSQSVLLYVFLTLYYESLNGARQMMAVAIGLYAFFLLVDNIKSKKGWILLVVSIGVHNTAIFLGVALLGIYIAKRATNKKKLFIRSILISILIILSFNLALLLVSKYLPRYSMYMDGSNPVSILQESGSGRIAYLYILEFGVMILCYFNKKSDSNLNNEQCLPYEYFYIPSLIFCVICGVVFSKNVLITRLLWYYQIMFIVYFPNALVSLSKKNRFVISSILMGALFLFSLLFLKENKGNVVPYQFFFEIN